MKILVVDDHPDLSGSLRDILRDDMGYEPLVAETLDGARELLCQVKDIDVVITDWNLGKDDMGENIYGDGIVEDAHRLRKSVAVWTSSENDKHLKALREQLKGEGFDLPVISKDWSYQKTVEAIKVLVEGQVGGSPEKER